MESCIAKDSCQPVEERYQTVDEVKLGPLKEFIMLGGNGLLSSDLMYGNTSLHEGSTMKRNEGRHSCQNGPVLSRIRRPD